MTTILPDSVFKTILSLTKQYVYYFLCLIFMLYSNSVFSQLVSNFTTNSSNTGCGSLVVEFEDLSTGNPNTWLWDFGNGNTSSLQHPVSIYQFSGFYTVKLTITDSTSQDVYTQVDYIKVHDKPMSNFSENITSFCVPLEVSFTDLSSSTNNIVSWLWDFGDGGSSTDQNPSYEYTYEGLYPVSLYVTDDKGCENILIVNSLIDAKSVPQAIFSTNLTFSCDVNEQIVFSNNSISSINYTWNFGDGQSSNTQNPQHNYSTGIYDVKLVADNGLCADTLIQNNLIEIGSSVIPDFESNVSSVCMNNNVQFTDISNYNPDTWNWDFGDGHTSNLQNPIHIYQNPGIYTVSLTNSINGECVSIVEKIDFIEVFEDIEINISANDTVSCTLPFNVSFHDNTTNAISWNWQFENGDSSNLQNPNIVFNTYDNFDLELSVTDINGCVSTINETDFIITDRLRPDLSVSNSIICNSDIIDFTDLSTSLFPITSYLWDFGDGQISTLQNPQHQFIGVNTFDITLTIENNQGCLEELILIDLIKTVGSASSDFEADRLISCAGENINFTDLSSSLATISSWNWDFGDGSFSVIQNPTYQYNQTGNFDVTLIVGEGNCTDTLIKNYYIEIIEPSSFFIPEHNCVEPLMVNFSNLSSGADFVEWDFGDGFTSTDFNPTHIYSDTGEFDVRLRVVNNITLCTHEYTERIIVNYPVADFTYLVNPNNSFEDSVVCSSRKRSHIENLTENLKNYRVDWGDGYLGINRSDHLYTQTGVYDVTLMVTDIHGCKDTLIIEDMYSVVDVESDFSVSNVTGCDSLIVYFEDLSSVNSSVLWDFGDGSTSFLNNPQHVYRNEGFYDITLFSESIDGCKDTLVRKEYIKFIYPEIDFDISDDKICKSDEVIFLDSSKGISLEYNWDFGDGTTSFHVSPIHNFNSIGIFPVSLMITDTFGCSTVHNLDTIKVQEVEANFTSTTITSSCPPLITTFTDESVGNITNYKWDFGDGLNSTQISPSHLYSFSGEFDVQLIVEDDFACKDTLKHINLISIFGPTGNFTFSTNTMCNYDSVEFTANVQNTDFYYWDFGDGIFSNDSNPIHTYSSGDFFHPKLVIENLSSCQLIVPSDDSIHVVEITIDAGLDRLLCLGDSVLLESIGSSTNYTWNSSPYLLQDSIANTIAFPLANNMFYVTNSDGMCFATDSVFVRVDTNIPKPFFTTLKNCYLDSMELYGDAGINASSFSWEWTVLAENLYRQDDYFQFDTIGLFNVELLVTNLDNNCDATINQIVEVLPLPQVNFRTDEVCFGEKTHFINLSGTDVTSVLWSFGDGHQSSFDPSPSILFSSPGIFNSTLVVESDLGCLNAITKEVVVHKKPEVYVNITEACEGAQTGFTSIIVLNDGYITDWTWDFGDESILSDTEHTSHVYENWGEFDVSLQVRSNFGCISSVNEQAIVNPNPEVFFDVEQICKGDITRFTSQSSIVEGNILHYSWSFGDGNTSVFPNSSNEYSQAGIYPVNLFVSSAKGCSSNLKKKINIFDLPKIDFLADREVCELELINFIDNTNSDDVITEYNWDFGDRRTSSKKNPSHSYKNSGVYDILLSVETANGCKSINLKDSFIIVYKNPIAEFDMSDRRVSILDSEVLFTNSSDSDLFFEWDFDNGIIDSDNPNITINFTEAGNYDVLLYIENDIGCSDEIIHQVIVDEAFSVFIPIAFTPNNDGLNDVFLTSTQGVYEFEMKIFNRWGDLIFSSDNKDFGWDGSSSITGNIMKNDTYMYTISVTDYNDKPWVYNGKVNLMK